jgi:hypothetical protein
MMSFEGFSSRLFGDFKFNRHFCFEIFICEIISVDFLAGGNQDRRNSAGGCFLVEWSPF